MRLLALQQLTAEAEEDSDEEDEPKTRGGRVRRSQRSGKAHAPAEQVAMALALLKGVYCGDGKGSLPFDDSTPDPGCAEELHSFLFRLYVAGDTHAKERLQVCARLQRAHAHGCCY